MVTMLAPKREFAGSSLRWIPKRVGPGRYIHVQRCGGLSRARLQLKDPLELFLLFLSRRDVTQAVDRDSKPHSFIPSFQSD